MEDRRSPTGSARIFTSRTAGCLCCCAVVVVLLLAGAAGAQQTSLGSIVDQGSTKLSDSELRTLLTSGIVSDEFGDVIGISYTADGTLEASWIAQEVRGEWKIDDRGLQCIEAWDQWQSERWSVCRYWFKLGDSFYVLESKSDADRQQPVRKVKPVSR